jgi:hypothetical protein
VKNLSGFRFNAKKRVAHFGVNLGRPGVPGAPEVGRNPLMPPGITGEPCWTRTSDPLLKRQVL